MNPIPPSKRVIAIARFIAAIGFVFDIYEGLFIVPLVFFYPARDNLEMLKCAATYQQNHFP